MSYEPIPLPQRAPLSDQEALFKVEGFRDDMRQRRTIRHYDPRPVPEAIIRTAQARIRPVLLTTITTMAGLAPMMFGLSLIALGSPFATAGYLGILAKWALAPDGPIKTFLARGGTASLTAYLLQNMVFGLIFYGYALGLYATLGAASVIGIAILVALFSIAFTSLWRTIFKRGPLEYVLRGFTYLGAR